MSIKNKFCDVPIVSIVTATFNSERFVMDTYLSIAGQTFSNWEWIVTDDCSTDSTRKILDSIQSSDKRVIVLSNDKNEGAAVSRNKSISASKGKFIAFIDSDDLWLEDKLSKQINFMAENIDFSFTSFSMVDEKKNSLHQEIDCLELPPLNYLDMLKKKATLGCSTVVIRRNAFNDITMPLIRTGQDYATWLKLLKEGKKAYLLPEVLTEYRIVAGSISRNKIKKALRQWQIYREIENIGLFKSCYYFLHYAYRALAR